MNQNIPEMWLIEDVFTFNEMIVWRISNLVSPFNSKLPPKMTMLLIVTFVVKFHLG
jgi:hypothetical protein